TRTYTYNIPSHLRDIEYVLSDLEVVVFVAEGQQEIVTGAKSEMQIVNGAPAIKWLTDIETCSCASEIELGAVVFNFSETEVSSMEFKYRLDDGAEQTVTVQQALAPMTTDTVSVGIIPVVSGNDHVLYASLPAFNSSVAIPGAPFYELPVKKTVVDAEGDKFMFVLTTDRYASETSFKIYNPSGVYLEDGGFKDLTYNGITRRQYVFDPPASGCYKLEVYDTGGNGISSGNGNGYIEFRDATEEANLIFRNDGKFGSQANYHINITDINSSIAGSRLDNTVRLYPNPVSNLLHVEAGSDAVTVEVFNMQGQKVCFADKSEVNVAALPAGVYMIKVHTDKGVAVKNFVKQ
ncbi:MAG: T9SS type A sorting domain-containing protein, partial [Cytophagaceae bacterium]|nr:T9SS type A sorting domain-containing protein [Cytophagaceae bacterium]